MNKDEAIETTVRFLLAIYRNDTNAVATITNAHATYKEQGDTKILVDALMGVIAFSNDMIDLIR